jgi:uncharacterized protein YqhQ
MADGPKYVGGQAVIEGVMMRGASTWAVAARLPDGRIVTTEREAPAWASRFRKFPLLRGVATLGESLSLGMRALTWSADQQIAYEEQAERAERIAAGEDVGEGDASSEPSGASKLAMRIAMVVGIVIFVGLFMVLPGVFSRAVTSSGTSFNVVDGIVKFGLFLVYLAAIGLMPDIRRLFQYHGAEHKAIAAYENGVELTPRTAQQFTTEHVRCGTSFLLIVVVISILSHLLFGRPGVVGIILTRVLLVVPIAAVSYEVIRFLAEHQRRRLVRWLSIPGLTLQRLTTREPTLEQLEVAITSLKAVLPAEERAAVEARTATVPVSDWVRTRATVAA